MGEEQSIITVSVNEAYDRLNAITDTTSHAWWAAFRDYERALEQVEKMQNGRGKIGEEQSIITVSVNEAYDRLNAITDTTSHAWWAAFRDYERALEQVEKMQNGRGKIIDVNS